jgi:hypothetical protein
VRIVWLGLATAFVACSLITDLSGLGSGDAAIDAEASTQRDAGDASDGDASDGDAAGSVCPPTAIFCDDFENEPTTLPRWDVGVALLPSTLGVTQSRAFRGSSSMYATVSDTADSGAALFSNAAKFFAPIGDGSTFAMRAYVYLPAALETDAIFQLVHQDNSPHFINLGSTSSASVCKNNVFPCIATYFTGTVDVSTGSSAALPIGAWSCIEWVVTVATAGHETVYVDGAAAIDFGLDTVSGQTTGYDEFTAGLEGAYGTEGVFIDDVVVDTKRIGCEP